MPFGELPRKNHHPGNVGLVMRCVKPIGGRRMVGVRSIELKNSKTIDDVTRKTKQQKSHMVNNDSTVTQDLITLIRTTG